MSFSWKNRIMGQVLPIGPGHDGNPITTVPVPNGLVGAFELAPRRDAAPGPVEHVWKSMPTGFETTGSLRLNGGLLKQTLRVDSVGEQTVIYQDRVIAQTNVSVSRELGVPLGIENDEVTGGRRVVCYQGGRTVFDWKKPRSPVALPGPWANVDGRLGVVIALGSGLGYQQGRGYDPHTAVCADVLYGSFSERPRQFKAGEEVARRVVLLFTEVTPRRPQGWRRRLRLRRPQDTRMFRVKLPEGAERKCRCYRPAAGRGRVSHLPVHGDERQSLAHSKTLARLRACPSARQRLEMR